MTNQEAIEFLKNMIDREAIGFVCPEREGDVAIWQYHVEALQMAISALQEQEAKAQLSAEGTTSDLISRQDAIDALWEIRQEEISDGRRFHDYCSLSTAVDVIKDLPSAQPEIEERTEEFAQNVPKEDLISRKAAIDAVEHITSSMSVCVNTDECHGMKRMQRQAVIELANLPSAEPEPCEDTVSREAAIDVAENAFVRGLLASPDIRKLPAVQPEPQWVPVSERLPEKYGNYLISIHGEDEPDIGTINPNDKRGWSLCDANGFHWASDKKLIVTAWMPLPEPYRAERRTDE